MGEKLFCIQCGQTLLPEMQFCTNCGTKVIGTNVIQPSRKINDIKVVDNMAQWIIPHQNIVGRKINQEDFENIPNFKGITIQKGVVAIIYVDGRETIELHGGSYEFISQDEINAFLEQYVDGGLINKLIIRPLTALGTLIRGKQLKDKIEENSAKDFAAIKTMNDVISRIRPNSSIEVYLLSETPFTVVFNSKELIDGKREVQPMTIRCRNLSVDITVIISFHVNDPRTMINKFISSGERYLTTYSIEKEIEPRVRNVLEEELRDADVNEYGISDMKRKSIESRLKALSSTLPGIQVTDVVEISTSQEALKRLRDISEEIFISEKELEAAIRTNDFRNRLATVENQAKIDEARNDFALYKALTEIDKEKILHEDELDNFYMLVSRQRKIREAKNEEEIRKALQDLEQSKLLSQDDYDAFMLQLANSKFERETIAEMTNMQHLANVELRRMEIEDMLTAKQNARDVASLHHKIGLNKISEEYRRGNELEELTHINEANTIRLKGHRDIDEYNDSREDKKRQREREDIAWQLQVEKNIEEEKQLKRERRNAEFQSMMSFMAEQHEREEAAKHGREMEKMGMELSHERSMETIKGSHEENMRELETRMSYEQLLASRKDLDPIAQAALAETVGAKQLLEQERQNFEHMKEMMMSYREQERQDAKETRDILADLTRGMIGTQNNLREEKERLYQERYNDQRNMAMEYREEKYKAQERQDSYSKHVMDHETKLQNASLGAINAVSGRQIVQQQQQHTLIRCPHCSNDVPLAKFCAKCGSELNM